MDQVAYGCIMLCIAVISIIFTAAITAFIIPICLTTMCLVNLKTQITRVGN